MSREDLEDLAAVWGTDVDGARKKIAKIINGTDLQEVARLLRQRVDNKPRANCYVCGSESGQCGH